MRKILVSVLLLLVITSSMVFAQSQEEEGKSSLSYRNITIYKVLDHKEVYIVLYAKHGVGVGQVMIPKTWYRENPRKLQLRLLDKGLDPFMTVVYKDGEFHKVILTTPSPKRGDTWGVASDYTDIGDSAQAETLDIQF
ncbi:MAG: hypothetical protein J6B81_01635 [Spirochaetaceae bacterium]|nr:hypothetical protein [Spirochaetaceae bacterium]